MALDHHKRHYPDKSILIVCPASKRDEGGWQRTIKDNYPNVSYDVISYNLLNKKWKDYTDHFIIFDECHRIKNSTGVWGKSAYKLCEQSGAFILLSATPLSNGWEDSINYFKIFNLIKNKTQFIKNYAITTNRFGYLEILDWKNTDNLTTKWNKISHRLNKSDAIDLPSITFETLYFKPNKEYKEIKKKRIYNDVVYDSNIKLRHGLRLHSGSVAKLKYLEEFIESTNQNIIIFYNYVEELEQIKSVIKNKIVYEINGSNKDYPKKEDWDNVSNSVTLCNYKSGSEAVELTYASIIIYFSPTDSYTEYVQSYGRAYRIGQEKKVTCYKYIAEKTVDENIYGALDKKENFNWSLWEKEEVK